MVRGGAASESVALYKSSPLYVCIAVTKILYPFPSCILSHVSYSYSSQTSIHVKLRIHSATVLRRTFCYTTISLPNPKLCTILTVIQVKSTDSTSQFDFLGFRDGSTDPSQVRLSLIYGGELAHEVDFVSSLIVHFRKFMFRFPLYAALM